MISRRFFLPTLIVGSGFAQDVRGPGQDTVLALIDAGQGAFAVGVRTRVKADHALIIVFYKDNTTIPGTDLLLSRESMAPVAGWDLTGVTRDNFNIPREAIQFVRVIFMDEVSRQELKV